MIQNWIEETTVKNRFNKECEIRDSYNFFFSTVRVDKNDEKKLLNKTRDVDGVPISFVAARRHKADSASRLLALAEKF